MSTAKKLMGTTASGDVGAWDLSYAYYDDPNPYDISTASYVQSRSVGAYEASPNGVSFSSDGTKMYVVGVVSDTIYEYGLSTPWDISNVALDGARSVGAYETSPNDLFFKPDGTKMYVVGQSSDSVHEYSLSTAWSLSTSSYVQNFYVGTQEGAPEGLFFKPDGTKMYIVGSSGDDVNEYSLSAAWDVSTASYFQNFSIAAQETSPAGIFFHPGGARMYIVGFTGDDVNEYSLSTAWDISTASYVQSFSVAAQETSPAGIFFKSDGLKMYVIGESSDSVHEYNIQSRGFYVGAQETSPKDVFFNPDGTKMYVIGTDGDNVNEYSLSTSWDTSTASYVQGFYVGAQEVFPTDLFFKPDGTKMYVIGTIGDNVNEYSLSTAWDVSTASYVQNFSVATKEDSPQEIFFNPDGTKMYVIGTSGDDVNEYSLGTAWDVSTASYVQNFSVAAQDTVPTGLFFKPDGTKMYVIGDLDNDINEYSLSTAWDVSTASYVQNFSVAAQETNPSGIFFKPDGTKMFIVGYTTDSVYTYTLGVQE